MQIEAVATMLWDAGEYIKHERSSLFAEIKFANGFANGNANGFANGKRNKRRATGIRAVAYLLSRSTLILAWARASRIATLSDGKKITSSVWTLLYQISFGLTWPVFLTILEPLISRNARIAPSSCLQTSSKIHAINLTNLFFHHHLEPAICNGLRNAQRKRC